MTAEKVQIVHVPLLAFAIVASVYTLLRHVTKMNHEQMDAS